MVSKTTGKTGRPAWKEPEDQFVEKISVMVTKNQKADLLAACERFEVNQSLLSRKLMLYGLQRLRSKDFAKVLLAE